MKTKPHNVKCDDITGRIDLNTVPANVQVGRDVILEGRITFKTFRSEQQPGLIFGDRVRVYEWTSFSIEPAGVVAIGDDTVLTGAQICCGERIDIGRRVVMSWGVTIFDTDFHPVELAARRADTIAVAPGGNLDDRPPITTRPVKIGDDVQVGINAIILKGVTIGDGARIAAGSVVTRDVKAGAMVAGNPARVVTPNATDGEHA